MPLAITPKHFVAALSKLADPAAIEVPSKSWRRKFAHNSWR